MAEVKRRKNESFDALLRRFNRKVVMSGRILQAKKIRFHDTGKSKTGKQRSALRRLELQKHYEYLARIGKLPPDPRARNKRS